MFYTYVENTVLCSSSLRLTTGQGGNNGCEDEEDECRVESNASEPEVDTLPRAWFDTLQNRQTAIPPIGIRVVVEHMAGTKARWRKMV